MATTARRASPPHQRPLARLKRERFEARASATSNSCHLRSTKTARGTCLPASCERLSVGVKKRKRARVCFGEESVEGAVFNTDTLIGGHPTAFWAAIGSRSRRPSLTRPARSRAQGNKAPSTRCQFERPPGPRAHSQPRASRRNHRSPRLDLTPAARLTIR